MILNCLDTEPWKPIEQALARNLLGLPADVPLLLFGAMGGGRDPRKGFAVRSLGWSGQLAPRNLPDLGFPIHFTGHLRGDLSLRAHYGAVAAGQSAQRRR